MFYLISTYWPHILFVVSLAMGAAAAIHAAMTKEEVRAAIGWVGVILLSPVLGALVYAVAGVNRIRRSAIEQQRSQASGRGPEAECARVGAIGNSFEHVHAIDSRARDLAALRLGNAARCGVRIGNLVLERTERQRACASNGTLQ